MKRYDFMSMINKEAYPMEHYIHERGGFVRFTDVEKENADRDLNFSKLMDQYMAMRGAMQRIASTEDESAEGYLGEVLHIANEALKTKNTQIEELKGKDYEPRVSPLVPHTAKELADNLRCHAADLEEERGKGLMFIADMRRAADALEALTSESDTLKSSPPQTTKAPR
jgi:hypothetical protein